MPVPFPHSPPIDGSEDPDRLFKDIGAGHKRGAWGTAPTARICAAHTLRGGAAGHHMADWTARPRTVGKRSYITASDGRIISAAVTAVQTFRGPSSGHPRRCSPLNAAGDMLEREIARFAHSAIPRPMHIDVAALMAPQPREPAPSTAGYSKGAAPATTHPRTRFVL